MGLNLPIPLIQATQTPKQSNSNYRKHQNKIPYITPQFYKLRILEIQDLYTNGIAKLMNQHSNQITPACFSTLFTNLSSIHARQTRSITNKNLYLPNTPHSVVKNLLNFKDQKFGISYLSISRKRHFLISKKYINRNYSKVTCNCYISSKSRSTT